MPTMTVTIPDAPSFAAVKEGYTFSGTVSLPETVSAPIKINSISLYYNYGRRYVRYVYLMATCGDTTFNTNYFSLSPNETLKKITVDCNTMIAGNDHLLKQNGRQITFRVACDYSTSGVVVDRASGGEMTLTVNYTLLFEPSKITAPESVTMGDTLTVTVPDNGLNAGFEHTATLALGSQSVSGVVTGPGAISLTVPRTTAWLSEVPDKVIGEATLTLTTVGSDQTGETTQTVNMLIPDDVLPTLMGISVERIDGRVPSEWGLYLKGESAATLTIEGAKAGEGSEIAGYRIEGAGFAGDTDVLTTGKLPTAGAVLFRATVTDRRGRSGAMTVELNVAEYNVPSLSSLTVERCDQYGEPTDDGTYLTGTAEYLITPVADNSVSFKTYVNGILVTPINENSLGRYTFMLEGPFDTAKGYEVKVAVFDAVTAASTAPASLTDRVPTATVGYDLMWDETAGDYGVSFGRYTQNTKRLSIPADWKYYRGDVDIEGLIEEVKNLAESNNPLDAYPVGALYWSSNPTSPAELFGGIWTQLMDIFILAAGNTYRNGEAGGEAVHTLLWDEMPVHEHTATAYTQLTGNKDATSPRIVYRDYSTAAYVAENGGGWMNTSGRSQPHNNMPPYLAKYCWERMG